MEVTLSPLSMNELVKRLSLVTKKMVLEELKKEYVHIPKTMTVKEVAQLLRLSEWTVRQRKEELGYIKMSEKKSGRIIFSAEKVLEYMTYKSNV